MIFSFCHARTWANLHRTYCASTVVAIGLTFTSTSVIHAQEGPTSSLLDSQPDSAEGPTKDVVEQSVETQVREIAELHRELRRLEKGTAKAKTDGERALNITELCQLFVEVGQHPEIAKSPTLQSLSVRLRTRLRGIERRTSDELRRRGIEEPEEYIELRRRERLKRSQQSNLGRARSVGFRGNHVQQDRPEFGQRQGANSAGQGSVTVGTGAKASDRSDGEKSTRSASSNSSEGSASSTFESSSNRSDSRGRIPGGNAAPGPDYSWQLVNLIHMTIQPDYWSVAGGPGKAIYFGNARALVIHGSWRVQEDVADLLTALRGG
ncbi:MAG: hypothetical protein ACE361_06030 [Aureliella sp.]